MTAAISLSTPDLTEREQELVAECVASGWVSTVGPFVERFETEFAQQVGSPHAVACASGTAAIHLALDAVGVGPDDIVLCSDSTFVASANPARHLGAEVRFVDSEPSSWNMDVGRLRQALGDAASEGRHVAAVIAVHVLGSVLDIGPIVDVCRAFNVPLIEDAAEGLAGRYHDNYQHALAAGRWAGTVGRIGCYSFNGNKLMTCGGGGMVVTADSDLAQRVRHLSTQAKVPGVAYVHDAIGYNFRLTNLAAAMGLAQLERLDQLWRRRRRVYQTYRSVLADVPLRWQADPAGTTGSRWLSACLIDDRDGVVARMQERSIQVRPVWLPVSAQACYRGSRRYGGAIADDIADRGLALPSSSTLSDHTIMQVARSLRWALTGSEVAA